MSENKKIRVGIAGLGRSGWGIHAAAVGDLVKDLYEVAAVFDLDASRRQDAVDRFGCQAVDSFDALTHQKDVELIVVATPSQLHPEHTIDALEAGKHVVCEKPVARSTEEMDRVIAASQRVRRVYAPFQNRRYAPDLQKVQEVIASGKLGRIVQIRLAVHSFGRRWDWQTLREFGGGELNNTGPHFIDQALQLFGPAEPEIFCHMDRTLTSGDADDHVNLILRAPGAPLVEVEITHACPWAQEIWLVMGTSGGLHGTMSHLEWKYVDFSTMPERPVDRQPTPGRTYNREELQWTQESWDAPKAGSTPGLPELFYRDLYKTLREGAELFITPQSVRRQIAVIEQCHATAEVAV